MIQAFYLGISVGFLCHISSLRFLKWPMTSRPLVGVRYMFFSGIFFVILDYWRRAAIQRVLLKNQHRQFIKELRKNPQNYQL